VEKAKKLAEAGINIDYIYGSAMQNSKESIFVVHIAKEDLERVKELFKEMNSG
jgi:hypothetical protein